MPPLLPEAVIVHNAAVDQLWADYGNRANGRVPITFASDEALWLRVAGHTFREFYTDPAVQLHVMLAGQAWMADNVVHDLRVGPPAEAWTVSPRFWMDEPEFFGCEVRLQDDSFAWSNPVAAPKGELLARLDDLDSVAGIGRGRLWALYVAMRDLAADMTFRDLPVRVHPPGAGTHGTFTVACHVRGAEALCLDVAEDPEFAGRLLGILTEQSVARIRAWHQLAETGVTLPLPSWGMADDSIQFISARSYEDVVLPWHEVLYATMTDGSRSLHLCGQSQQHYDALYHRLGIRALDGPGTFVDHGTLLAAYPELSISAQGDHTRLLVGPCSDIRDMMRDLLTVGAKQPGRFQIMGFLGPDTPPEHVQGMYEAGREFGQTDGM